MLVKVKSLVYTGEVFIEKYIRGEVYLTCMTALFSGKVKCIRNQIVKTICSTTQSQLHSFSCVLQVPMSDDGDRKIPCSCKSFVISSISRPQCIFNHRQNYMMYLQKGDGLWMRDLPNEAWNSNLNKQELFSSLLILELGFCSSSNKLLWGQQF